MNVLITSASRKVGLVQSFQQALKKEGGGRVIAVDASPLSPALYLADEHHLVPRSDSPEFLVAMLRLCQRQGISLIIPTRDEELPVFAGHADEFAAQGCKVMVAAPEVIALCQDKKRFLEFCRVNGFGAPRSYDAGNLPPDVAFPLFIKPRWGKGGRQAQRVDSRMELDLVLGQVGEAILQERIQAPEYTVDLFADFSGRVLSAVPRARLYVWGGEAFVSRTSRNPLLIRESVRLAEGLHLVGHNTIQCFLHDGQVKFIEVNPRFGGGASLGFAAGAPTPLYLVRLVKGEALEPRIGDFKDGYVMLRYTDDLFMDAGSLAGDKGKS